MESRLRNRIEKYRRVSQAIKTIPNELDQVVESHKDVLLALNRDQMLLGRNAHGILLSPTYQLDPFFETKKAADNYAKMKAGLEGSHESRLWSHAQVYPRKPRDVPNLIVTGPFQNGMFITTGGGEYTIWSSYIATDDIDRKYNGVFGLAPKSVDFFWTTYMRTELLKYLGIWGVDA